MLFLVLTEEQLLVKGDCPCRNGGRATGVCREEEGDLDDRGVLSRHQENLEVAFLSPAAGNINQRRVRSEETMGVFNEHVVRFPWMLG